MEPKSNDELAAEIAEEMETDFFRAMNAYRAARSSGDREAMEQAERHLQEVVRGELTGEQCVSD